MGIGLCTECKAWIDRDLISCPECGARIRSFSPDDVAVRRVPGRGDASGAEDRRQPFWERPRWMIVALPVLLLVTFVVDGIAALPTVDEWWPEDLENIAPSVDRPPRGLRVFTASTPTLDSQVASWRGSMSSSSPLDTRSSPERSLPRRTALRSRCCDEPWRSQAADLGVSIPSHRPGCGTLQPCDPRSAL